MTTPTTTPSTTQQLPTGTWSVALRDQLAKEAIARMGPNPTEEHKCAVMAELVEKLQALRDYDRFDPKQVGTVVAKRDYREVDSIYLTTTVSDLHALQDGGIAAGCDDGKIRIYRRGAEGEVLSEVVHGCAGKIMCLQALPDGRIVSGSEDRTIRIWTKDPDGEWSSKILSGHHRSVSCLQYLPDGRIVSGSFDTAIRIWNQGADGKWSSVVLSEWTRRVSCLQALPDGGIVVGYGRSIAISTQDADGRWTSEFLRGHEGTVHCLQALPDGRILSGSEDETVRMWTKGADGQWSAKVVGEHEGPVQCLQSLPDGRIFSGSHDGTIRIWTKTASSYVSSLLNRWLPFLPIQEWSSEVLSGNLFGVACLQVLPDGRIFSGSLDGPLRIWDGEKIMEG